MSEKSEARPVLALVLRMCHVFDNYTSYYQNGIQTSFKGALQVINLAMGILDLNLVR